MIKLTLVLQLVATTSVERTFFAMKTIKIDLRNRMRDELMDDTLIIMYIKKEVLLRLITNKCQ